MRIAFYAPLKPIDHPSPSGDRRIARSYHRLLRELGHDVRIACQLRSFDRDGDAARQNRLVRIGANGADRLAKKYGEPNAWAPDLWFTYHTYHKAPDYVGPRLAASLGIPYVNAEASVAGKQQNGRWRSGFAISLDAAKAADALIAMTKVDELNLHRWVPDRWRVHHLPPFIDISPFAAQLQRKNECRKALASRYPLRSSSVLLVVAAMMREDIKKQSYLALIEGLKQVSADNWQLLVIGDGPAREEIALGLKSLGKDRVIMAGEQLHTELAAMLAAGDFYVWPAFEEAYGMSLLEAQAAGLPVIVCREGGVPDIVVDGQTGVILPGRSMKRFAEVVSQLIVNENERQRLSRSASAYVAAEHDWQKARTGLQTIIDAAFESHRARQQ